MILLYLVLYYLFSASSVFMYGLGMKFTFFVPKDLLHTLVLCLKLICTVLLTIACSWFIINKLLLPYGFAELYPLVCLFIIIVVSKILEALFQLLVSVQTPETLTSLTIVILAINESTSLIEALVIGATCSLAIFAILPLLHALKKRLELSNSGSNFGSAALFFFSIAIILLAVFSWNVSWLNIGVIK